MFFRDLHAFIYDGTVLEYIVGQVMILFENSRGFCIQKLVDNFDLYSIMLSRPMPKKGFSLKDISPHIFEE